MSIIIQFLNDHFHFFVSSDSQIYCMNFLTSIRKHFFFVLFPPFLSDSCLFLFYFFFFNKEHSLPSFNF